MEIQRVDPRTAHGEVLNPRYRVYFWGQVTPDTAFHSDEHELDGAVDVSEVIEWARANAGPDRTYVVYVVTQREERLGLIRLLGSTPPGD